jgi:transcription antitermination factor NusG
LERPRTSRVITAITGIRVCAAVSVSVFPHVRLADFWVIGFLTSHGKTVPVPAKQVEDLQLLLSTKVPCSLHPFLRVGQRVRIRGGCLNGVEGILTKKDPKKLVISIESMERAVAVEIAGYELDPV